MKTLTLVPFVVIASIFSWAVQGQLTCNIPDNQKIDCGYAGINQQQCEGKGCCWVPLSNGSQVPWCFNKGTVGPTPPPPPPGSAPFSPAEVSTIMGYFLANVDLQGSGAVVAAPDYSVGYWFHWRRDGAIALRSYLLSSGLTPAVDGILQNYVQWELLIHSQSDPNGIDVRGEPKFFMPGSQGGSTGQPYNGGWCRPQNDGAGLVAGLLAEYALGLLKQGNLSYVKEYLWTGSATVRNGGLIKTDLDYVEQSLQNATGCDLWEEIRSADLYFTLAVNRRGFYKASKLVAALGDSVSAAHYQSLADQLKVKLATHYKDGYIQEEMNLRPKDAATIVALNDAYCDDGFHSASGPEAAGTIQTLNNVFGSEYQINQQDTNNGVPGILYGRYPGDVYFGGNPWILNTFHLGLLYYRAAQEVLTSGTDGMHTHWFPVLGRRIDSHVELAYALLEAGDGCLTRVRYHSIGNGLHMNEQIDRNTGYLLSAKDLTWNYASLLSALQSRQSFFEALKKK